MQWKGRQDLVNTSVIGVRYVSMYLRRKYSPAQWPIRHTKLSIALIVKTNAWYIFWHVRLVLSSMLIVPQIVSDIVGAIINVMAEDMREVRLVCKNICLNILIVKGVIGSYMTFQIHWLIKQMQKNPIKREHYWQHTLKTLAPHGLNVEVDF